MRRAARFLLAAGLLAPAARVAGQGTAGDSRACPAGSGIAIGTSAGGATGDSARAGIPDTLRASTRQAIDTTWSFDIRQRQWSRPWWTGFITAGVADGTSGAPAAAVRPFSVCAGVTLRLQQPTLMLRGARGTVRLRADLSDLSRRLAPSGGAADTAHRP